MIMKDPNCDQRSDMIASRHLDYERTLPMHDFPKKNYIAADMQKINCYF